VKVSQTSHFVAQLKISVAGQAKGSTTWLIVRRNQIISKELFPIENTTNRQGGDDGHTRNDRS
jgi:hypothetical protein